MKKMPKVGDEVKVKRKVRESLLGHDLDGPRTVDDVQLHEPFPVRIGVFGFTPDELKKVKG